MKKRLLALLLVLAMVLSMMPMGVLADDWDGSGEDSGEDDGYEESSVGGSACRTDGGYDGIEVEVHGRVAKEDRRGIEEAIVVAAAFEYGQMIDSAYTTAHVEENAGGFQTAVHLDHTPVDTEIRLFLLRPDLQPIVNNWDGVHWVHRDSGQEGDIEWDFYNGRLTLNGTFPLSGGEHGWDEYKGETDVLSTSFIGSIDDGFFQDYTALQRAELGSGLMEIGANAFRGLPNLSYIELPSTLRTIGENAFADIDPEAQVVVPEDFPWDTIDIGAGNEIIEKLRPTEDTAAADAAEVVPETTEETVLETTEETVPETTEETIPETTEETQPETEETELTAEEAADEGYYIAPKGAVLQETGALEEMAAYSGTDKAGKGYRTASFTGLLSQQVYTFIVSREPGSLKSADLQYIDFVVSDAEGKVSLSYEPRTSDKSIVQLYGPEKLTLEVDRDYLVLSPGESIDLYFHSNDSRVVVKSATLAWSDEYFVYAEELEENHWRLKSEPTPDKLRRVETQFIDFYARGAGQEVSTRIRVDLLPNSTWAVKATLGETKLTRNIYDSEPTQIPIFLDLKGPDDLTETAMLNAGEDTDEGEEDVELSEARMIQSAAFTDETLNQFFSVSVQDDHTLLLNTAEGLDLTDAAVVKAIKSSYKMSFRLTLADGYTTMDDDTVLTTDNELTLTVQKKLPTVKAAKVTLNPYTKSFAQVQFTGGTVLGIVGEPDEEGNVKVTSGILDVRTTEEGIGVQLNAAPKKNTSANVTVQALVDGCNIPVKVTIPVKVDAKAPTLKLGQTSWEIRATGEQTVEIPILCTTKGVSLDSLTINCEGIYAADGKTSLDDYYWAWVKTRTGILELTANGGSEEEPITRPLGKQTLILRCAIEPDRDDCTDADIQATVDLKLTVTNGEPVVKLGKSQITFNAEDYRNLYAHIPLSVSLLGEDLPLTDDDLWYYIIESKKFGYVDSFFAVQFYSYGEMTLQLNLEAFANYVDENGLDYDTAYHDLVSDTFTMYVDVVGDESRLDQWAKLTIRMTVDAPQLTSLKASGSIDRNNDDSYVTLTSAFKNAWGTNGPDWNNSGYAAQIRITNSKKVDCTDSFDWSYDYSTGTIRLYADWNDVRPDAGKYTLTLSIPSWKMVKDSQTGEWNKEDVRSEKSVTFNVTATKPAAKVSGKVDSLLGNGVCVISNYYRLDAYGFPAMPTATLSTTGKQSVPVPTDLYTVEVGADNVTLWPRTDGENLLPAGKYTLTMDYGDGTVISAPITVIQSVITLKVGKSSFSIHPYMGTAWTYAYPNLYTTGEAKVEYFQANGKTPWDDQDLINVQLDMDNTQLLVSANPENAPDKDTTVKVKLTPDSRVPSRFTWLTVKVLGGKNLTKKFTMKAENALDPSYSNPSTWLNYSLSGIDNVYDVREDGIYSFMGDAVLMVSTDKGKTYQEVDQRVVDQHFAYPGKAFISVRDFWDVDETGDSVHIPAALDPSLKYRLEVTYGDDEHVAAIGTGDIKVAYGSNKFTVEKAPTFYKKDPNASMDIHLNAKNIAQEIENVTIKGNTDFDIHRMNDYGSDRDWVLEYWGGEEDLAKLKTTSLTLQIFLKGNTTAKPNATATVKVTVK